MPASLTLIQDVIQEITEKVASTLGLNVEFLDENLVLLAGSGTFPNSVGRRYAPGILSEETLRLQVPQSVFDMRSNPTCRACHLNQSNLCHHYGIVVYPLTLGNKPLGTMIFTANNLEQQRYLIENSDHIHSLTQVICLSIFHCLREREAAIQFQSEASDLNAILEMLEEPWLKVDAKGYVTSASKAFLKQVDLPQSQVEGKAIGNLFPDIKLRDLYQGTLLSYFYRGNFVTTCKLKCKPMGSGDDKYFLITVVKKDSDMRSPGSFFPCKTFDDIVGGSPQIQELIKTAKQVSQTSSTVLILGESGTGKELFAQAIHSQSPRKNGPFVPVNCAAIPETLLESELFGYEEGAFTGARRGGKPGKFEIANGGTIFLDEIADMPMGLQAKLLRVIEQGYVDRIGDNKPVPVNVRIIAATNRDLKAMIKRGQFREDLYYRINVIPLRIPPLRERKDDIVIYAEHFLKKFNQKFSKDIKGISPAVKKVFLSYPWPGNVRELENAVEYAVNMETSDQLSLESLRPDLRSPESWDVPRVDYFKENEEVSLNLKHLERQMILNALRLCGSDTKGKKMAAKYLGIGTATLYRKLKEYGIGS